MKKMKLFVSLYFLIGISEIFAQGNFISTQAVTNDLKYFSDWTASELNKGFKEKQLKDFKSPLMKNELHPKS